MGGGGGGSNDYPDHMINYHTEQLSLVRADMLIARNNNPYSGRNTYNPTPQLNAMADAIADFDTDAGLSASDWADAFATVLGAIPDADDLSSLIAARVSAFTNDHDAERLNVILPRFKAGFLDSNAVMTSAFIIGQGIIESYGALDVARYDADLTEKAFLQEEKLKVERSRIAAVAANDILNQAGLTINAEQALLHYRIEVQRMGIAARKEEDDQNLEIDASQAAWSLSTYTQGSNMLAAITGGVAPTDSNKPTKMQSALGGAAAGASVGANFGPQAAIIGGIVGAFGGYLAGN